MNPTVSILLCFAMMAVGVLGGSMCKDKAENATETAEIRSFIGTEDAFVQSVFEDVTEIHHCQKGKSVVIRANASKKVFVDYEKATVGAPLPKIKLANVTIGATGKIDSCDEIKEKSLGTMSHAGIFENGNLVATFKDISHDTSPIVFAIVGTPQVDEITYSTIHVYYLKDDRKDPYALVIPSAKSKIIFTIKKCVKNEKKACYIEDSAEVKLEAYTDLAP